MAEEYARRKRYSEGIEKPFETVINNIHLLIAVGMKAKMMTHVYKISREVGSYTPREGDGLTNGLVGWVRFMAKGIDNKHLNAAKLFKTFWRHLCHICDVRQIVQPVTQDRKTSMHNGQCGYSHLSHIPRFTWPDDMSRDLRHARIAVLHQAIWKALPQMSDGVIVGI